MSQNIMFIFIDYSCAFSLSLAQINGDGFSWWWVW
jgi:hypothetical protein